MGPAAQDVGEVAAGFGEQVVACEGAAHHIHHDVDGGQRDVDHRPHPRPHRRGSRPRPLSEPVDGAGAERPDRGVPPSRPQLSQGQQLRAFGRECLVGGLACQCVGGPLPRRVPLPFLVPAGQDGHCVLDLLASGRLPANQPLWAPASTSFLCQHMKKVDHPTLTISATPSPGIRQARHPVAIPTR
jgi:hypothetical protein